MSGARDAIIDRFGLADTSHVPEASADLMIDSLARAMYEEEPSLREALQPRAWDDLDPKRRATMLRYAERVLQRFATTLDPGEAACGYSGGFAWRDGIPGDGPCTLPDDHDGEHFHEPASTLDLHPEEPR